MTPKEVKRAIVGQRCKAGGRRADREIPADVTLGDEGTWMCQMNVNHRGVSEGMKKQCAHKNRSSSTTNKTMDVKVTRFIYGDFYKNFKNQYQFSRNTTRFAQHLCVISLFFPTKNKPVPRLLFAFATPPKGG
eukprot:GHVT01074988.1.p1 GENE.GHVT01074988.1~~GHVT01074988.1.p1  ORF type:complete len:133 (+),score=5.44 GHVT01074988.1:120-518(+)